MHMVTMVIATARTGRSESPQEIWGDLIILCQSIACYVPDADVVVAWKGPCSPLPFLPKNLKARVFCQPERCDNFGKAFEFAIKHVSVEEFLIVNDDTVLLPNTVSTLLDDVSYIKKEVPGVDIGFLAARSNYVCGPQNIRNPNGGAPDPGFNFYNSEQTVIETDRVSPILAWTSKTALDAIGGFPPLHWFSDDLMCWDWQQKGYRHFVSRAYVHHIGQRSTAHREVTNQTLHDEAMSWLGTHRPDFLTARALLHTAPLAGMATSSK